MGFKKRLMIFHYSTKIICIKYVSTKRLESLDNICYKCNNLNVNIYQ